MAKIPVGLNSAAGDGCMFDMPALNDGGKLLLTNKVSVAYMVTWSSKYVGIIYEIVLTLQ